MSNIYRSGFHQPFIAKAMDYQNQGDPAMDSVLPVFDMSATPQPQTANLGFLPQDPQQLCQPGIPGMPAMPQEDAMINGIRGMLYGAFTQFQQTAAEFEQFISGPQKDKLGDPNIITLDHPAEERPPDTGEAILH